MTGSSIATPRRVAVVVVHGVGDNQAGSTVNYVVDKVCNPHADVAEADRLTTPGHNEVHNLPEPSGTAWLNPIGAAGEEARKRKAGRRSIDEFRVYGRQATLPGGGTARFYELHWADLARAGTGWTNTATSFARFIFEIPHVIDGFMRDIKNPLGRVLRMLLLLLTCFVRGPLAGYCAVMLVGSVAFLTFSQIPEQENVRRLLNLPPPQHPLTGTEVPGYQIGLIFVLGFVFSLAVMLAIRLRRWPALVYGAGVIAAGTFLYICDAALIRPERYPFYAGMVYIDYLSMVLLALAGVGAYIFQTRREKEVGFADLGLFTAFWALFFIFDLSPLGDMVFGRDEKLGGGVTAASSSIHFRAFEIYYPILKWLWAFWGLLMGSAMILAVVLWLGNFWRWDQGYRGIFASLALAVIQSCVWLSVLPAFSVLHLDSVLCASDVRHANDSPPVSCEQKLAENHRILELIKVARAAEQSGQLKISPEVRESLVRTLQSRENARLNAPMLKAMQELALSFLWHTVILGVAIGITLLVATYRHWRTRWTNVTTDKLWLPRLIVSNWVIAALCLIGAVNVVLCLGWVFELPFRREVASLGVPMPTTMTVPPEAVQITMMAATAIFLLSQLETIATALGGVLQIMRGLIDHHYRSGVSFSRGMGRRIAENPSRRQHVTARLHTLVSHLVQRDEENPETHFDDVIFLAHSQGTVIVFDYLKEDAARAALGGIRPHVVTAGSPLGALYSYYFNEYSNVEDRISKLAVLPATWTNLYRSDDPIAGRICPLGKTIADVQFQDVEMKFGGHLKYWEEPEVSDLIRNLLIERAYS